MAYPAGGDSTRGISEKTIQDLDARIETLKIKYTLFFNGEEKMPPEKQRTDLEKAIRLLLYQETKSARVGMLLQNLSSKFSLFNNLWLKRLNEMESGVRPRGAKSAATPPKKPAPPAQREAFVTLGDDGSFTALANLYRELQPKATPAECERVAQAMKAKMASHRLAQARVILSVLDGKLNVKIKSK